MNKPIRRFAIGKIAHRLHAFGEFFGRWWAVQNITRGLIGNINRFVGIPKTPRPRSGVQYIFRHHSVQVENEALR